MNLWSELDNAVLACLTGGDGTPADIGQQLGISEAAASSLLAMLALEGRIRICWVALDHSKTTAAASTNAARPAVEGTATGQDRLRRAETTNRVG
jgi:hypothetical protein